MVCEFWISFGCFSIFGSFRVITEKFGLKSSTNWSSQAKLEVGLVELDVFMNYWTVQFREISSRAKSPNFEYGAYRAYCIIRPVMVKFSRVHSSKNYTEALGASQCRWFNYWSLSGILFILLTLTPSRETILREDKTERL